MIRASGFAVIPALVVCGGCAHMKPGLGFDEVKGSISDRAGMRVHWDDGSPEDQEVRSAVGSLLGQELTADSGVQIALLNNRDLQVVYEELNLAQADLVQAGLLRNPVFSGEVRFGLDDAGTAVVLDLSQEFLSVLYIPLRKGRAQAAFEAARLRVTGAVLDLAGEVRAAFYDMQAAEQLMQMRRTVVEATEASYELSRRLREAGNVRDLDVSNERALYEQSKVDLAAAEAEVQRLRERLNELMHTWGPQTGWRIAARLPAAPEDEVTADGLERRAIERSLDLEIDRKDVEVAARSLGIARPLALFPELEVGVAAERELEGDWSLGPSVSLPIPLFDQGQATVGAARAHLRQAVERYAATAVHIRAQVRAAYAATAAGRDRARYYESVILPLRQKIVDETQLQYNAMQVSAFQLLQAKRDQIDAGAEYIGALRGYWVARAGLDQILAGRLLSPAREGHTSATLLSRPGSLGQGGH